MSKKTSNAQEKQGLIAKAGSFKSYLDLSRAELRKVTWPTLKETRVTSLVVLGFVVVMSIFLGLVDLGLSKLIASILAA